MERNETTLEASSRAAASTWEPAVRSALARVGRLALDAHTLSIDADLLDAGLTSQAAAEVVFSIEDEFGFELDDSMITRSNLATIGRMAAMFATAAARV